MIILLIGIAVVSVLCYYLWMKLSQVEAEFASLKLDIKVIQDKLGINCPETTSSYLEEYVD